MKLALVSPLPPARTGIADYTAELLPYLRRYVDVTLFTDDPAQVAAPVASVFPVRPLAAYPALQWHFDLLLYQIGNSTHHQHALTLACRYPGVVVLHDFVLHHLQATRHYARALGYGLGGRRARRIRWGGAQPEFETQPLNDRLLATALGAIVHSRWSAERIHTMHPSLPLAVVPFPTPVPDPIPIPPHPLTFAVVGQITPAKRVDLVLTAFARLRDETAHLHLIGGANGLDVPGLLQQLDPTVRARIRWQGHVAGIDAFHAAIAAADVVLALRDPTVGETSAAALRALSLSKPLIVFDHGWYAELPDSVALKVAPGDIDGIVKAMRALTDPARRRQCAAAAIQLITNEHDPDQTARRYAAFLDQIVASITATRC